MTLQEISKFISNHGAWALIAVSLALTNIWTLRMLVASWTARLDDLKEGIPVMQEVRTAMDMQSKVLENFIQELRIRDRP